MDSMQEYAVSIIVVAFICSVLLGALQNSAAKGIIRVICGMVMTIAVAAPLCHIDLSFPGRFDTTVAAEASAAAEEGKVISHEAWRGIIKQETESYILDKAKELGAGISVEISMSNGDPPLPEGAVIFGQVTPHVKRQLQEILQTQLGIAKESLEWTG